MFSFINDAIAPLNRFVFKTLTYFIPPYLNSGEHNIYIRRAGRLPGDGLLPGAAGLWRPGPPQVGPGDGPGGPAGHTLHAGRRDGAAGQRRLRCPRPLPHVLSLAVLRREAVPQQAAEGRDGPEPAGDVRTRHAARRQGQLMRSSIPFSLPVFSFLSCSHTLACFWKSVDIPSGIWKFTILFLYQDSVIKSGKSASGSGFGR